MKVKLFLAASLLALLIIMPAGFALADNGPHGGYTATTDACAGCHRAHTATAANLLVDTVPNLCYSCHGTSGLGADTNVEDGVYLERDGSSETPAEGTPNRGLKGGGFVFALMDTRLDNTAASTAVTSSHLNNGSTGTAWGNGAIGSGPGAAGFSLSCTSCHDPHGGAGPTGQRTYRLLRYQPLNSGGTGRYVQDENVAGFTYTISDANNKYFGEGYPITASTWTPMDQPEVELSGWCQQCHTRYLAFTGNGSTPSGDAIFAYRHMSSGAPGATCNNCHPATFFPLKTTVGPEWHHNVECATCHVAHGTSASMTSDPGGTYSANVPWPDGATAPNGDARSSLLRADNRGVCQRCHGK